LFIINWGSPPPRGFFGPQERKKRAKTRENMQKRPKTWKNYKKPAKRASFFTAESAEFAEAEAIPKLRLRLPHSAGERGLFEKTKPNCSGRIHDTGDRIPNQKTNPISRPPAENPKRETLNPKQAALPWGYLKKQSQLPSAGAQG
jgi:hypothetical protein